MARNKMLVGWAATLLLLGTACQRTEVTTENFVGQVNPGHTLKLVSQPSLKVQLIGVFHGVEAVGSYTMHTEAGTIEGQYTYVYDGKGQRGYIFHPVDGKRWEATLGADGTFKDSNGEIWRIQHVAIDKASETLGKHLVKIGG